jgi:hypothetical protein
MGVRIVKQTRTVKRDYIIDLRNPDTDKYITKMYRVKRTRSGIEFPSSGIYQYFILTLPGEFKNAGTIVINFKTTHSTAMGISVQYGERKQRNLGALRIHPFDGTKFTVLGKTKTTGNPHINKGYSGELEIQFFNKDNNTISASAKVKVGNNIRFSASSTLHASPSPTIKKPIFIISGEYIVVQKISVYGVTVTETVEIAQEVPDEPATVVVHEQPQVTHTTTVYNPPPTPTTSTPTPTTSTPTPTTPTPTPTTPTPKPTTPTPTPTTPTVAPAEPVATVGDLQNTQIGESTTDNNGSKPTFDLKKWLPAILVGAGIVLVIFLKRR